ncbi:MAG TPA: GWxTD domain-containing protein [Thermoanaerobaculia bacterium]|jgi:GWxTD domain-containing protein|nr:GWxTD domain-containing protein [Thermoanaerobaculia bacterium]
MPRRLRSALLLICLAGALLGLAAMPSEAAARSQRYEDLTNPLLGPDYAAYLLGAVSRMATVAEVEEFLALRSDEAAAAWVERFWQRRDLTPKSEGNLAREVFDVRSDEADRLYSESAILGRHTARGAIFVLYGTPAKVEFDITSLRGNQAIEVWRYDDKAPFGLDGKKPVSIFRFIKEGGLTVPFMSGRSSRRPPRRPPG